MKKIIIILLSIVSLNAEVLNTDFLSIKNRLFNTNISYSYIKNSKTEYIHVDMEFKSPIYANSGGISLSFPELKKGDYIKNISSYGFDKLDILEKNSPIWHKVEKKNILSKYLLIEGWNSSRWNKTIVKTISFDIDSTSLSIKEFLTLQFRIILLKEKNKLYFPLENVALKDQQGFSIKTIPLNKFPIKSNHD